MNERGDAKVSERYRALGREEPGAALDAAILAAARRAAGARPGGSRTGLRRWTLPVSVAAVVVLSVTVTLQLQRERPDAVGLHAPEPKQVEQSGAREAPAAGPKESQTAAKAESAPRTTTLGAGRAPRLDEGQPSQAPEARARPFVADPAASSVQSQAGRVVAPSAAPADAAADRAPAPLESESMRSRAESAAQPLRRSNEALQGSAPAAPQASAKAGAIEESPERWLERIVALRSAGRDREADESFAEFRKRYPDYRISDELLGKLGGKR